MTGPEHYREAEQLAAQAKQIGNDQGPGCGGDEVAALAQVHATLALADFAASVVDQLEMIKIWLGETWGEQ